jgi:hypothetical protein
MGIDDPSCTTLLHIVGRVISVNLRLFWSRIFALNQGLLVQEELLNDFSKSFQGGYSPYKM